jgi:hypothetical protein
MTSCVTESIYCFMSGVWVDLPVRELGRCDAGRAITVRTAICPQDSCVPETTPLSSNSVILYVYVLCVLVLAMYIVKQLRSV